jgi:hypothetical protein
MIGIALRAIHQKLKLMIKNLQKLVLASLLLFLSIANVNAQNFNEIIKAVASDRGSNDNFGHSVAISGDYAIVGAVYEDEDISGGAMMSNTGSAYIFERDGSGNWNEVQKIVASDRAVNDNFGNSVSISGDYAIVGAHNEDEDASGGSTLSGAGSAYIFERNGSGVWTEVQKIVASDRIYLDQFGYSVAISGDYTIVGAYSEDEDASGGSTLSSAGSAYIYERNGSGAWNEVQKTVASDRAANDYFGYSVSISGGYAIVGAKFEDEDALGVNTLSDAGSAYIFERNVSGVWTEVQKIVASDRGSGDFFGYSVSISGNYAIVGAIFEDEDASGGAMLSSAGSAYIFERNGSGAWTEVQKIVASDRAGLDYFGYSVAISGGHTIVGAIFEDEDASGGSTLSGAGSAYIFESCTAVSGTDVQTACDTYTWIDGNTYNASNNVATFTLTNVVGCDSVVTLDLTINNSSVGTDVQIACDTYTWIDGNTYSASNNVATFTLTNAVGCDSVVTLDLTINNSSVGTDIQVACDTYTWIDGNTYNASNNVATFTLTNAVGCDSVVTLDLTINSVSDITTTTSGVTITANNSSATYAWLDCDNNNAVISGETGQSFTVTANGNYAVELTENGCVDTSACENIITIGISENTFGSAVSLYPNPTTGDITIDLGEKSNSVSITITDLTGKIIQSKTYSDSQLLNLTLDNPAGVYLLMIESGDDRAVIRLIKE